LAAALPGSFLQDLFFRHPPDQKILDNADAAELVGKQSIELDDLGFFVAALFLGQKLGQKA
jgi:hypothetical protein